MRRSFNISLRLLFIPVLFLSVCPLFAQRRITIRLASLVPENTPWGAAINKMASDWARVTNGEVEVIVYHNGTAGDEPETLRKLRLNQIQAAVFTSLGLNSIMPEVMALSYPFLIRDNAELDEVLSRIKPELNEKIQQNGFTTLAWARAGWIKIFSKSPVHVPNDLRRLKLGTSSDELQMIQAFRLMGYQIVPISINDILVFLNGGMIDAIYQSPIYAAGTQIFGVAKNMSSINIAPFMGGILMNNTAWRRIPERYRPQLMEICREMEATIEASIVNLETEAVSTMLRHGLILNELSVQQEQEWYTDMGRYENSLVGTGQIFNREYYLKINDILTNYRRGR
ncbi:MAG: TRAP transporter substrate-binding protein DctP [Treponema sp.]|nr:TRAP transporter substrate-binding protein DctP [Treponema sp.]